MAEQQPDVDDSEQDTEVHEVSVKQISEATIAVEAESRKQAFEAIRDPNHAESQRALIDADYSFVERRPEDARRAEEYEDNDDLEPDIDVTDYDGEHNERYNPDDE